MATRPAPGTLYTQAEEFQAALARRDARVARELADAYGRVYADVLDSFEALNAAVRERLEAGDIVRDRDLIRMRRYQRLVRQVEELTGNYAAFASERITQAQAEAVRAAIRDAGELIRIAAETGLLQDVQLPPGVSLADILPTFSRVPEESLQFLVGTLGDGTPLREYFLAGTANVPPLPQSVVDQIRRNLAHGLTIGWNPVTTARLFREAMGVGLNRSLRIARTETLRSYREASRANYVANGINEYEWLATLDVRTCLACIALDGQRFSTEQPMQNHVNCRCTMVPVLPFDIPRIRRAKYPERAFFTGTGEQWFESLTDAQKLALMGPGKFEIYRQGRATLQDFVDEQHTETFGVNFVEKTLQAVLEAA